MNKQSLFQQSVRVVQLANSLMRPTEPEHINKIRQILTKPWGKRSFEEQNYAYLHLQHATYLVKIKEKYNEDFQRAICDRLYLKSVVDNGIIATGKTVHIYIWGKVKMRNEENEGEDMDKELVFGDSFNEIGIQDIHRGIIYGEKKCEFACVDYRVFADLMSSMKLNDNQDKINFIKSTIHFQNFSENEVKYLSYYLESVILLKNVPVYTEGDTQCQYLYFLRSGDVGLYKQHLKNQVMLVKMYSNELFGEESLLGYTSRQFTVKCVSDQCQVYRITREELDKRLWSSDSRSSLFQVIQQKWILRHTRFHKLSKTELDKQTILQHMAILNKNLIPDQTQHIEIADELQQSPDISCDTSRSHKQGCSNLLKNIKQANIVLQQFKQANIATPNVKNQIQGGINNYSLKSNYPLMTTSNTSKSQKFTLHNTQRLSKVSSNLKFIPIQDPSKTIQQQLETYISKQNIKDEDIEWGDDGTQQDKTSKIKQFYDTINTYAIQNFYSNQNIIEANSTKAKQLNKEYSKLIQKQRDNIKNTFDMQSKSKSDNTLRKEYFLRQLKIMQKRLKVLQLIKNGVLTLKYNQYVNEEGEIATLEDNLKSDDIYIVVNGQKQPRFNFVTQSNHTKDFDRNAKEKEQPQSPDSEQYIQKQISEQREQINTIRNIVSGKVSSQILSQPLSDQHHSNSGYYQSNESNRVLSPIRKLSTRLRLTSANVKPEYQTQTSTMPMRIKSVFKF